VAVLAACQLPGAIAVDSTYVYWADNSGGNRGIRRMPLGGGAVTTLATVNANSLESIAVSSSAVFWTDIGAGTVMSVPLAGGEVTALASSQNNPANIAVDETNVYWTNLGTWKSDETTSYVDGAVMSVPLRGGTPTALATGVSKPEAITVDAVNIYWGSVGAQNTVMQLPKGGGTAIALNVGPGSGTTGPGLLGIVSDGTNVYWTDEYYGFVLKAPVGGGSITMLASSQDAPTALTIDATDVYWLNFGTGSVMKVPISGGTPVMVAPGPGFTSGDGIAVDATSVYWGTNALMKLTPK
jgi:hypothetical protein